MRVGAHCDRGCRLGAQPCGTRLLACPMPFLHTELLLFNPERGVVHGMPILVGNDEGLLRNLLEKRTRNVWCAGLIGEPRKWLLRVACHEQGSSTYVRLLTQSAGSTWYQEPTSTEEQSRIANGMTVGAAIELSRVWLLTRRGPAKAVTANAPAEMKQQAGFWFPCDGVAAIDLSRKARGPRANPELLSDLAMFEPTELHLDASAWVERVLSDRACVSALRDHAECAFLIRPRECDFDSEANAPTFVIENLSRRPENRRARLGEANLHSSTTPAPGGTAR